MTALKGIRVIDLSRHAPGPYCTMLLADFGADVIMIEEPPGMGRRVDEEFGVSRRSKAYNPVGRNKRSVTLNLKNEAHRDACLRLIDSADVVVEGFRPGVAKRLGVDYETVRERNPRAVYCSISGYGQEGPYRDLVGHDLNYISLGGALGLTGWPGQPPAIPVNALGDFAGGGLFGAFAVLTAIIAREHTGRGQYIDMAMSDGVTSLVNLPIADYFDTGKVPRPGEYFLNGSLPCYNVYRTADEKWLSVACMEPWFWSKLCVELGCEQFSKEQFNPEKFDEMFAFLRRAFKTKTRDTWFSELKDKEICVTPVYELDEALEDPHLRARKMIVEAQDPELGKVPQVGIAPKLSDTPGEVRTTVPRPGTHSREVFSEAGFSAEEINSLVEGS